MSIQAQMQLDETLDALKNAEAAGDTDSARILADRATRLKQEVETSFSEEDKSSQEAAQRVADSPITAATVGAVGGALLGKPTERLAGKVLGATYSPYGNTATGEPPGWKWARKTGFGAGMGETVQAQDKEYKKRMGLRDDSEPEKFRRKGKTVERSPLPGKALSIEQSMANAERDAMEARIKAQAAKSSFWKAPTGFGPQVATVAGKTLGGAGALGMGAQAALDFDRMIEALKKREYAEAAKAARSGGLSTVGALGSAATFIPHPLAKGVGTALGVAAPLVNTYLESKGYAEGGKLPKGKSGLVFTAGKDLFNLLGKSKDEILKMGQAFEGTTRQQNPELARAIDAYRLGKISRDEYLDIASKLYSPKILGGPPEKLSPLDIAVAIGPHKASKGLVGANVNIAPGTVYDSRLDIPGYLRTERNVSSMEFPEGNVYGQAEHMGPSKFISNPTKAMRVGLGTPEQALTPGALEHGMAKSPFAVIRGPHIETDADEIRRMMKFYSKAPEWKEIGMNPYPYSQFFDKQMVQPVWGADEVLKYGNYVLARNPEMTHWKDPRLAVQHEKIGAAPGTKFAEGGLTHLASGGKTPAWQRAEGKNPEGGLNAKGRASYHAETGGTLKRPQPEGGARRDSFCARMKGMKKKLTSSETANDPDSRINKSLRKWNC